MLRRCLPLLLLLSLPAAALPGAARADAPGSLHQSLRQSLRQDASQESPPLVVMNLAAHPDDEDGSTLTYYRKAKDAVAYSVIFTRGEGGQNEIGSELYEALGALRTEETLRAARQLGTQVYFLNFDDFGYSKRADEAFAAWGGRDHVTARLVYLIRKLKPDVLFTNHDTVTVGPGRQHGQHQAVGLAAYDAFTLAADPGYHPEQLGDPGVDLWQPARLFLRHWRAPAHYDVGVPVGDRAADGRTYVGTAMDALREHASQGMGFFASRFRPDSTYFTLLRRAPDAPSLPDGAADLAAGLRTAPRPAPDLTYRIDAGRVPAFPDGVLVPGDSILVPGERLQLRWDPTRLPARRLRWRFHGPIDTTLVLWDTTPGIAHLTVDPGARPTMPKAVYQYDRYLSHPPVVYAAYATGSDSLVAAGYLPIEIAPPLVVETERDVARLRPGRNHLVVRTRLFDPAARRVTLNAAVSRDADGTVLAQEQRTVPLQGAVLQDTLTLTLPADLQAGDYTITVTGLPTPHTQSATPARAQLAGRVFQAAVPPGLNVGVVESYDNTLAQALAELGVDYVLLDSLDLARGAFDTLHTVVVDIRAYLVRADLRAHNAKLLDWVARGGHLVVNYQKTFEWNADAADPFIAGRTNPPNLAPYPLQLGRDRITREDAPVEVLLPDLPLFRRPNPITPADWEGWVQERGLYFPETYDARYRELFSMRDPDEAPLRSSTLLADYGKGTYLYTALGWYRQLKDFHPGAYRLFANLISLPLTDGRVATTSTR